MQKPDERRGSRTLKAGSRAGSLAGSRGDTCLVIPPRDNPRGSEAALRQAIEDWLIPRLLEEFLAEKGIAPKSRFAAKTECLAIGSHGPDRFLYGRS